jgi:hypothetical protein
MEQQEEKIVVKFETKNNIKEINALAAAASMEAVTTMIQEVHQGFQDNHKLLVKARPFSPGSFEIPLDLIVVAIAGAGLYDKDIISSILNIIKEYFNIKQLLKGETPKVEGGRIVIKNNVINANNITLNLLEPTNPANKLVSKAFTNASFDDSIKDMQIIKKTNNETIAHVKKSEFGYYEIPKNIIETPEKDKEEKASLVIYGPILDANNIKQWKFFRDGKPISANITDDNFLAKVKAGEQFASGDTLEVDLLIRQKFNQMLNTYIDSKKTITRVHRHTKKPEQTMMDFDKRD